MSATTIQPLEASHDERASPESRGIALRAIQGEGEPTYLALGALRLDERNVRKDEPTDEEIEQLADLIDAQGLLQNLTVVAYDAPVRGKGKDKKRVYTHGVIAGGRRLRSLLRLVKRARLTLDEEILCTVVPAERAIAVSTAENSGRAPMSPADTIVAFAEMVRAGAGMEDLAVCFHLSPLTVQRRLKLAHVSPALFALFREGSMTLDQLMALALTDVHEHQEAAWNAAPAHDRTPRRLRALIAGEGVSPAVIRFVGVEAYEAAGGGVLRDLFADTDEKPAFILDAALMMRMATAGRRGSTR
jgi:ParB family transcriptional regulator, chromosome partitioning protein